MNSNNDKPFKNQKMIILVGPTGTGKSFVHDILVDSGYKNIVSFTTRPQRPKEIDGRDYIFVSDYQFQATTLIEEIEFNGFKYGIPRFELEYLYYHLKNMLLIVEPNGLQQILEYLNEKDYSHLDITILFLNVPRDVRFNNILKEYKKKNFPENALKLALDRLVRGGDDIAERFKYYYEKFDTSVLKDELLNKKINIEKIELTSFTEKDIAKLFFKI